MRPAWGWSCAVLAGVGSLAVAAHAQGTAAPASRDAPVVEIVMVGGGHEAVALLGAVSDALGARGVVTEAHAVSTPADVATISRGAAVARVEVDLRSADEVTLVIEGRRQPRTRRALRRDTSPALFREELAQAMESAVESQLFVDPDTHALVAPPPVDEAPVTPLPQASASATTPSTAPPLAPPAPETAAPTPAPSAPAAVPIASGPDEADHPVHASPWALDLATVAGATVFADGIGPVATLGGEIDVARRSGWHPVGALQLRTVLPFEASSDEVTARANALAARALFGVPVARLSFVDVVPRVGGGMDVLWVTPGSAVLAPSVLGGASTEVHAIATASLLAHVSIVSHVTLTLELAADLDLTPSRYVVANGSARDVAIDPWRVRPTLLAGFAFTALGPSAFTGASR